MAWYEYVIVGIYFLAAGLLFLYSLGQLHLTWLYLHQRNSQPQEPPPPPAEWPAVTVQLPVYNEKYVIERLLTAVCRLDYPLEKLEIQVLDDSTDETSDLAARLVRRYQQKGLDIKHIRRSVRNGFKAGALAYGLQQAKGDFLAIFDADFLPRADFLRQTIPWFADSKTGVVQTRWGHINRNYSFFTKMQAFGLDAHFSVEQSGRNSVDSFINFNGTAGVWRRACIEDAGGWQADTLTEDLDLSYRAQLLGWHFRYLEDLESPAELPVLMPAIKSQQYRWNKGAAETARKLLGRVFKQPLPLTTKIHAAFHLLNSSVFLLLLIMGLLSLPMFFIKDHQPTLQHFFLLANFFLIGFLSIGFYFWVASKKAAHTRIKEHFVPMFFAFIVVSMGLALHNGLAVLEGLLGRKTPFVRTPKFNATDQGIQHESLRYLNRQTGWLPWLELLLAIYFAVGVWLAFRMDDFGLLPFHLMLMTGFAIISLSHIIPVFHHAKKD